jgi:hypothetical protein
MLQDLLCCFGNFLPSLDYLIIDIIITTFYQSIPPIKSVNLADRLKQVVAAISSVIPSTSPLTANMGITNDAEDQYYQEEVKALKEWWSDPRWRFTKRPFTAEQIASKRGNLPIQYPSNAMAKKLWKILEQRFAVSSCCSDL